jgi:predicted secreted protein
MQKFILLLSAVFLAACAGSAKPADANQPAPQPAKQPLTQADPGPGKVDYSLADAWLSLPVNGQKPVDVFYLYPTVISSSVHYCSIYDKEMRTEAQKLYAAHSGIFSGCNFYAPYYHQLSVDYVASLSTIPRLEQGIADVPMKDCEAAFEYFLSHCNKQRPIIFASHSQGTIIMKQLLLWLKEKHPEVLQRTIAAYMIGFAINQDYLDRLGMPFAQGRDDTGVIICYNTEAPGAVKNPFTMGLYKNCLAINPINWKCNTTYASKEESLGSRIRPEDATASIAAGDHPHFADARLDAGRGTIITNAPVQSGSYWPKGILHHYDYDLFYYDLKQNVQDRINAYFNAIVSLPGNKTTGYTWTYDQSDLAGIVKEASASYKVLDQTKVGSSGIFTFIFSGVKAGKTIVHFKYERPWEKGKAAIAKVNFIFTVSAYGKVTVAVQKIAEEKTNVQPPRLGQ